MIEMSFYITILLGSVILLFASAVAIGYLHLKADQRNRYIASNFQTMADASDAVERKKEELKSLDQQVEQVKTELSSKTERLEQLQKLNAELSEAERQLISRQDALEQANKATAELAVAQDEMNRVQQIRDKLKSEISQLEQDHSSKSLLVRDLNNQLQVKQGKLDQSVATLGQLTAQMIAVKSEKDGYEDLIKKLKEEREKAQLAVQIATEAQHKAENELQIIRHDLEVLQQRKQQIEAENLEAKERELHSAAAELEVTRRAISEANESLNRINLNISQKEEVERDIVQAKETLNDLRRERDSLAESKADKEVELQKLSAEVLRLRGTLNDGTQQEDFFSDLEREPEVIKNILRIDRPDNKESESNTLENFYRELTDAGYIFNKRTIRSFHTALKCQSINPLTVLAGVSGTGKTLLPILYSRYMGMLQLIISVQPRWDSPQDLFGFYNYLERQYKATDLSRLLWAYKKAKNEQTALNEVMTVVLFDEMNLARTEYYFSDFLSKLELRRAQATDAEIRLDTVQETISLPIPSNMLMIGTMNEDESTQTLSDKVLDRANVLRFGKPKSVFEGAHLKKMSSPNTIVSKSVWDKWCQNRTLDSSSQNIVTQWIQQLNTAMEWVGRPFGYRVQEAMFDYVRLYPDQGQSGFRVAFADQIEQKILPKMRGLDASSSEYDRCFSEISRVIDETKDKELADTLDSAGRMAREQGLFVWSGVVR